MVLEALAHTLAYVLGTSRTVGLSTTVAGFTTPGMKFYGFIVSSLLQAHSQ